MENRVIPLIESCERVPDHWSPRIVAQLNDYHVKLARLEGEFVWHDHPETDELFLVLEGELTIELRDRAVELHAGDLYVVPKGVEHRPRAARECKVLLIEPAGTVNTGNAGGEKTAPSEAWL